MTNKSSVYVQEDASKQAHYEFLFYIFRLVIWLQCRGREPKPGQPVPELEILFPGPAHNDAGLWYFLPKRTAQEVLCRIVTAVAHLCWYFLFIQRDKEIIFTNDRKCFLKITLTEMPFSANLSNVWAQTTAWPNIFDRYWS